MTEPNARSEHVRRNVAAAVEAVLDARGHLPKLKQIFEQTRVPMVMADAQRRFVEVNDPARVWFRLGQQGARPFAVDDLTPARPDVDLVYCGVAHILPGLHLFAFAPADWPASELDAVADDHPDASAALTPREIEVLTLAAEGLNGPAVARELRISLATVRTHLANSYEKLGVGNRAAAVAKAMRLGVIR